ncbi:MurR/RpiR family transcriptional regulator [Enterococcus rivorum]|uniref:RpiR family transcriptional regulator n=1 Tax=Enterococcus rivorum TaxID=762845 RepID=A0A1E5KSS4_9ENTE|nr:SIS domain-containing protein [Enterococcus rivorum]MBP2098165.1 DNA-binding MurR/RpiR family transcriptional regulator [Enterococcus rivorum]OEH80911.1 RpiR family transcriptional regulator [Enterococcus rivorum]
MDIEMLIEKYQLNDSESQVLRFMETHKESLKKMGIREVAKQSFVSTATIVNMSKKIGFSGYSELVFSFSNSTTSKLVSEIVTEKERDHFVQLMKKYRDKPIMVLGSGFSQNVANYFSEFLNLYKFRATANSHLEFLRENLEEEILIMIISNSGDTVRLTELARMANEHHIETIAFLGEKNSKIGRLATLTISTETYSPKVFREFSPNLFFGTALNQFELLMSDTLKSIFN